MRQLFAGFLFASILSPAAAVGQTQTGCGIQCPAGASCGCIDCRSCNSGSFQVICVCYPVPGKITCNVSTGDCVLSRCGKCESVGQGQTCITYAGCGGMNCGTVGCAPSGTRISCSGCSQVALPQTATPATVEAQASSRIGVTIESAPAKSSDGIVSFPTLRLRNSRGRGVVTVVIQALFRSEDGEEFTSAMKIDSWDRDRAFLAPGAQATVATSLAVRSPGLSAITLTPTAVFYEDGTTESLDSRLDTCLQRERTAFLEILSDLRSLHRTRGPEDVAAAIREGKVQNGWLAYQLGSEGMESILRSLYEPRRLKP
jgi:hypothetical protein